MPDRPSTIPAAALDDTPISAAHAQSLIERHLGITRPRLQLLWNYYRNPMTIGGPHADSSRRLTLAQERGLPARLIGAAGASRGPSAHADDRAESSREIVIENDIAWRIQTMVDFMFGRPITIVSTACDHALRRTIERTLDTVFEASGGVALLSDIGLLGHIYGHVDLIIRADLAPTEVVPPTGFSEQISADAGNIAALGAAHHIRIEAIEPTRAIPIPSPDDYRKLAAYIIRAEVPAVPQPGASPVSARPALARWLTRHIVGAPVDPGAHILTEIITPARRTLTLQSGPDDAPRIIASGPSLIAAPDAAQPDAPLPVVHIQNISQPFHYAGLSEVEPLIPLQDELNTRLSDRASRVTFQSFKMYLAKGLGATDRLPVGPGQVWTTDNPEATVQAFGGDGASPSEDAHIEQVREALDKASGVPPLASGVVRAKIGNLTSENALRITLMGLLSKTARKRVTYGRGLAQACELILLALHRAGVLTTDPADRAVRIEWPDPLPRDERETLDAAKAKLDLGVPRERVLSELGYAPTDPGIV